MIRLVIKVKLIMLFQNEFISDLWKCQNSSCRNGLLQPNNKGQANTGAIGLYNIKVIFFSSIIHLLTRSRSAADIWGQNLCHDIQPNQICYPGKPWACYLFCICMHICSLRVGFWRRLVVRETQTRDVMLLVQVKQVFFLYPRFLTVIASVPGILILCYCFFFVICINWKVNWWNLVKCK